MARAKAKVNPKVVLVDVSCVLHVGDKAPHSRNWSITDANGKVFKTGGISAVINTMRRVDYDVNRDIFVFCFDRHSFRKSVASSLGIPYKSKRDKMPAHLAVGSDLLYEWLPKMGFNAIALDGLESDDVIYSITTYARKSGIEVDIISTDRDLAVCIDEGTRLVSPNSKVPTVTFENYRYTIGASKGHTIPYNSVVLYKAICGDESDEIPSIAKQPYAIFRNIVNKLEDAGFDMATLSDHEVLAKLINTFESPAREKALDNLELLKMQQLDSSQVPMKMLQLNKEAVLEFATIIGSKNLAKKFGMEITQYPDYVMKSRLELTRKVAEKSDSSTYNQTSSNEVEPTNAIQAVKDIAEEERLYANVEQEFITEHVKAIVDSTDIKDGSQELNTDNHSSTISTDALE